MKDPGDVGGSELEGEDETDQVAENQQDDEEFVPIFPGHNVQLLRLL